MATGEGPMVQQRRLRSELRRARNEAGLTQGQVAEELDWSTSKVIRIENGSVSVTTTDLKALLHLYGVEDGERIDELVATAKAAREQAWWTPLRPMIGAQFAAFLGNEFAASVIRQYEALYIPGPIQIEEYTAELLRKFGNSQADVEFYTNIRMRRQEELFGRAKPPEMTFVVDEAAVRRWVGGPSVMRRQLEHVVEVADRPRVTFRVIPFSQGAHAGLRGPVTVFEYDDAEGGDVAVLENTRGEVVVRENADEVSRQTEIFLELEAEALGHEESVNFLRQIIDGLPSKDTKNIAAHRGGTP